jgi:alpha-ribazole phosphatase
MNVVLIRHTRIAVPAGLCYGHADVPLAESFPTEAAAVVAHLPWQPELDQPRDPLPKIGSADCRRCAGEG